MTAPKRTKDEPRAVYRCCQCGREDVWGPGWSWCYGFNPHKGEGVTCSDYCEDLWLETWR